MQVMDKDVWIVSKGPEGRRGPCRFRPQSPILLSGSFGSHLTHFEGIEYLFFLVFEILLSDPHDGAWSTTRPQAPGCQAANHGHHCRTAEEEHPCPDGAVVGTTTQLLDVRRQGMDGLNRVAEQLRNLINGQSVVIEYQRRSSREGGLLFLHRRRLRHGGAPCAASSGELPALWSRWKRRPRLFP